MYHYLFTNDLRISTLESSLQRTGKAFVDNAVPSAQENKSENNNMMTLGYYFNLTKQSNCASLCAKGNFRTVILNFIKKFQFPNPRTDESLRANEIDGITLAPMRVIIQVLFYMRSTMPEAAWLSRDEILDFIFYNSTVAKVKNVNLFNLINQIIDYRKTKTYPDTVERNPESRQWKHEERQIREMLSILLWSGCIEEKENQKYAVNFERMTTDNKAMLFDILSFNSIWIPDKTKNFNDKKASYQKYMDIDTSEVKETEPVIQTIYKEEADNILFYGVPGCGKSHTIKTNYCSDESLMERVVFHPDYTNSDFIGQILPENINGEIKYRFVPGPFTRILKKAYTDPQTMYFLVIEEINRGNAPAIFGEVFQLLDREDGVSEYGISNPDIAGEIYLREEEHNNPEAVKIAREKLIKIPSNVTILATMNTADQNVFTLDTAFKRRWSMRSIPNNFENCTLNDITIGNTNITWRNFAEIINYIIEENNMTAVSSEDKRLGAYFVSEKELKSQTLFAEKVLAYLWDDVFKYDRSKVFDSEIHSLDKLIVAFKENGINVFESILQSTLKDTLI